MCRNITYQYLNYRNNSFMLTLPLLFIFVVLFFPVPAYSQVVDTKATWQIEISGDDPELLAEVPGRVDSVPKRLPGVVRETGSDKFLLRGAGGIEQLREIINTLPANAGLLSGPAELKISTRVTRNRSMSLVLESNPSTGYRWEFVGSENALALQKGKSRYELRGARPGRAAKQRITVQAINDGDGTIDFVYRRPWEAEVGSVNRVTIQMTDLPNVIDLSVPDAAVGDDNEQSVGAAASDIFPTEEAINAPLVAASSLPSSWDWRAHNGVTAIRDQGVCGSCWAFGTVGVLESALKIQLGQSKNLSEQFLISCNKDGWSCNGGWWAHNYHGSVLGKSQTVAGAVLETAMPYTATNGTCKAVADHPYHLSSWNYVAGSWNSIPSVEQLKTAIYAKPVVVAICVGNAFQNYRNGVFSTDEKSVCGSALVNHAVVLVGWNDADQTWTARNSWGTGWGEQGYAHIKWGISNVGLGASYVNQPYESSPPSNAVSLKVSKGGTGSGTVTSSPTGINCGNTCTANFQIGTKVTLTAKASANSRFAGWGGACSGTRSCSVTMSQARQVSATFNPLSSSTRQTSSYTLTVNKVGNGTGVVTSNVSGINCGNTCSADYAGRKVVTLTATPGTGSRFTGWSGACRGTRTCRVSMGQARIVTAVFNSP